MIVVDLDNTLWGGVVEEESINYIQLGYEGIGLAFMDFQQELLKLYNVGILLAICSKNDEVIVWKVFEEHPCMILKKKHFVAHRINWKDKAENIQSLTEELSLNLENVMFLDDDPVQRAFVRSRLPVIVPDLPYDPSYRPSFLRAFPQLHRLSLTEEDHRRAQLYQNEIQREAIKTKYANLRDFLASIKQEAIICPLIEESLARAAQLCQKTNQFNLTTHRYTISQLQAISCCRDMEAYMISVRDIFGDNGTVGLGILNFKGEICEIDTFLLSCRVLGRKIEQSFLAFLMERAKMRNAIRLIGRYVPTEKNGWVRNFYVDSGFSAMPDPQFFCLDLSKDRIEYPQEINIKITDRSSREPLHAMSN